MADNRLAELAAWDTNALATENAAIIEFDENPVEVLGWDSAEIDVILDAQVEETDGDNADLADEQLDPPSNPVSKSGDLWLLGENRLLCGSSLDPENWTSLLDGRSAAMAFTDPPVQRS